MIHVDRALARKILGGDEQAFRAMFDEFFPKLYRFALVRLGGDGEAAADVVQQTFKKAIERLDTYRGEAALYTWFCQICRNNLIDYCRTHQREERHIRRLEDQQGVRAILESMTAPATDEPATDAWRRDVRRLVQAAVDSLPSRYGDVLEWKYIDGMTVKDIAVRLELGNKAAESLLTRARTSFREVLLELAETPEMLSPPARGWK
ncbi:MAG: sigma-70 family RNA polymerase sigma factor [Xanthomonadales bacterium]|nr:sigma-70 family RNA polymerase sigma factor [Xanthomonadales bacterium]